MITLFKKNIPFFINNNILSFFSYKKYLDLQRIKSINTNPSYSSSKYLNKNKEINNSFNQKISIKAKNDYYWYTKNRNKIIITSCILGISIIIFDVNIYFKKKKIENKIKKNIMEFLNEQNPSLIYISNVISHNYATKNINLLVNSYIQKILNKNPSIEAINIHFKKSLKNDIIKFLIHEKGQKYFIELVRNYLINISSKGIKYYDLYEDLSENRNKQDIIIDTFIENSLIKTLSTNNFYDYIIGNLVNEIHNEINKKENKGIGNNSEIEGLNSNDNYKYNF
jgi:hypothetical protein